MPLKSIKKNSANRIEQARKDFIQGYCNKSQDFGSREERLNSTLLEQKAGRFFSTEVT